MKEKKMNAELKKELLDIVENNTDELIQNWISYFDENEKNDEYRHYDDFLGFFEECIEADLNPNSDEAEALKHFLNKLKDIIGEERFFNFENSIYTSFLKFPIFNLMQKRGLFTYENIEPITKFFEAVTSSLIIELIKNNRTIQESSIKELEEREAPISEIWDGVLMVSIVGTLDSQRVLQIIDKVLAYLEQSNFSDVIVDISAIFDVNSEVTNQLMKLNNSIHFMGVNAYITGITANIAKSLTHLDINLGDIKTYSNTKNALKEILGNR
jgi:anti-anti-sigma regulatory factor